MYRLICHKPAHFLSAQMALLGEHLFSNDVYSTWDVEVWTCSQDTEAEFF